MHFKSTRAQDGSCSQVSIKVNNLFRCSIRMSRPIRHFRLMRSMWSVEGRKERLSLRTHRSPVPVSCNFLFLIGSDGKLMSVGERIRLPDDVTIGYIIEHLLSKKLTLVDKFHSHLEPMAMLNSETLADQVGSAFNVCPPARRHFSFTTCLDN